MLIKMDSQEKVGSEEVFEEGQDADQNKYIEQTSLGQGEPEQTSIGSGEPGIAAAESVGTSTESDTPAEASVPKVKLSKSEKKKLKFEKILQHKKRKRKEEKAKKKQKLCDDSQKGDRLPIVEGLISKRDQGKMIKEKLTWGLENGQRICIDLSLENHMSKKECGRLAQQIGRLYGSNRKAEMPAHIILTGIDKDGFLYNECVRKNAGFENYILDIHKENHTEVFSEENIVYLSPDSMNILENIERDKVYIIGGLVDETVTKNITQSNADEAKVKTARLPIDQYMEVDRRSKGNHSKILAVNQVFDILLSYTQTNDWRMALPVGMPRRKGYTLRADI